MCSSLDETSFDIKCQILRHLSIFDIRKVAILNKKWLNMIKSESFWQRRLSCYFPDIIQEKPNTLSYRQLYLNVIKSGSLCLESANGVSLLVSKYILNCDNWSDHLLVLDVFGNLYRYNISQDQLRPDRVDLNNFNVVESKTLLRTNVKLYTTKNTVFVLTYDGILNELYPDMECISNVRHFEESRSFSDNIRVYVTQQNELYCHMSYKLFPKKFYLIAQDIRDCTLTYLERQIICLRTDGQLYVADIFPVFANLDEPIGQSIKPGITTRVLVDSGILAITHINRLDFILRTCQNKLVKYPYCICKQSSGGSYEYPTAWTHWQTKYITRLGAYHILLTRNNYNEL